MTDTGPPYPPVPVVTDALPSPIFDVWETVQSQYANSPILDTLITNFAEYVDPIANLNQFFALVMDVDTAVGYGLDVWGRIVGINRILKITSPGSYFGFEEATDAVGFNQAPFYFGQPLTTNYRLEDQAYRTLILTKAMANITRCSIPKLNQMLLTLFPDRGNCYVTEWIGDGPYFGFMEATDAVGFNQAPFYAGQTIERMVMSYSFDFELTPIELEIVKNSGVLPRPTGVKSYVIINGTRIP
jgi:hypothetical protein